MICVHTVKMVKHTVKMARIAYIEQGILLTMSFHRLECSKLFTTIKFPACALVPSR